jgi:hypothetical protein
MAAVARARVADQYGEPALRAALTAAYAPAGLAEQATAGRTARHH